MSASVLASQFANLANNPFSTEAQAIAGFANAYATFAADATANGPITPAGVALGKSAMSSALVGLSSPRVGATVISGAVISFWLAVAGGLSTSFVGATAIVPPAHAGFAAAIQTQANSNVSSKFSVVAATNAMASVFQSFVIVGGIVSVGVSNFPII